MARVVEREELRRRVRPRERPAPPPLPLAPAAPPLAGWELAFYAAIIALAFLLRMHDLGVRALHHDESLHAVYAWKLFQGQGYVHDPMMHGPFQFHAKALMFFLFGDNEVTARLTEVLLGTGLVALTCLLRAELGRFGALAAAVLLALSPSLLYFSRFAREDILFAFHTLLMVVGLFGYVRTRQARWLYVGSVGLALGFSTKESIYLVGFLIFTFAVLWIAAEYLRTGHSELLRLVLSVPPAVVLNCVLITVGICVVLYTTFFTNPNGIYTGTIGALTYWMEQQGVARGAQPTYYYVLLLGLYEFLALVLAAGAVLTQGPRLRGLAVVTSLFLLLALGYFWLSRPERLWLGEREAVGWFLLGLAYAATLVLFLSGRGSLFFWFTLYWTLGSFSLYTLASEKMPWLLVHIALPLNLLAAQFVGWALDRADWRRVWSVPFLLAGLLTLLAAALVIAATTATMAAATPLAAQTGMLWRLALLLLLAAVATGLVEIGRRHGARFLGAPVGSALALGLFGLSIHTGWQVTYKHGDIPNDMLVYVQSSPDVPFVVRQLEYLGNVTGQGKEMPVLLDNGYTEMVGGQQIVHESIAWPFEWYLRDWKAKRYFSRTLPPDATPDRAPVILVMAPNIDPIRNQLGDYVGQKYRLNWWYPEDYKGWTPQIIWEGLRDPATRLKLWRYFLYREPLNPLGSRDFFFFVRSDLARGVVAGGPTLPGAAAPATALPPLERAGEAAAPPGAVTGPSGVVVLGRTATGAPALQEPKGLARDAAGRLYVLESGANRLSILNPDGTVAATWGRPGTGDGEFNEPWGLAVAPNGDVYVADTWNHRIQKFDAAGRFLTKWGFFTDTRGARDDQPGGFWGPRAIAIGPDGNLYVADTGNKRIQVFDPNGRFVRAIGGEGSGPGQFREPVGLAFDGAGNLWVADTWNQRIQKLDPLGRPLAQYPVPGWGSQAITNKPYLSVDVSTGRVYATVPEERRVLMIDTDGRIQPVPQLQTVGLQLPIGVLAGPDGALWVSDSRGGVVVHVLPHPAAPAESPAEQGAPAPQAGPPETDR
jgi:uncharacterized protein (TIGR03663 family)